MAVRIAALHDDRPAASDPHPAFAEDYSAARGKFRDAAQRAGAMLEAHRLPGHDGPRSEEHTSELQSLMRISYAVFCLKKKKTTKQNKYTNASDTKNTSL